MGRDVILAAIQKTVAQRGVSLHTGDESSHEGSSWPETQGTDAPARSSVKRMLGPADGGLVAHMELIPEVSTASVIASLAGPVVIVIVVVALLVIALRRR